MGQTCNYIAALLSRGESANKLGLTSCTSLPCLWKVPAATKVVPTKIKDLTIRKSRHGQEITKPLVSNVKNQFKPLESLNIDRNTFIDELRKAVPNACLLKGCLHNGQQYQNGDTVSVSLCESCVCNQGAVECKVTGCGPPRCERPVQVPGQCCSVCQGCEYRGRSYSEGQSFSNPQDRCEQCICQNGIVQCNRRTDLCSPRPCSHPDTLPGDCCLVGDGCLFMRRRFTNGQKFVPAEGDPCKICRCMGGNVTCMSMGCPPLKCKKPVQTPGYCCGVCPLDCMVKDRNYSEGQTFADPRDKCNVCTCADSSITCQPMVCPVPQCNNPTIRPGECCPSCQMCSHGDRQLQNGESYVNHKNPCKMA